MFQKKEIPLFPWIGKEPIYDYLKNHIDHTGKLPYEFEELPDTDEFFSGQKIRWVGGAMDSLLGGNSKGLSKKARILYNLLRKQCLKPSDTNRRAIYLFAMSDEVIGYIDPLLEFIRDHFTFNSDRLKQEAIWLMTHAAHRGPVKLGIALLGLFHCEAQLEILYTLGKHDEFTVYTAVAIQNGIENSNQCLFELAQYIDGWGKINIVERLEADTGEIKDWLLKHGCRNRIMNEYLAYTCAVKGNLPEALQQEKINPELYKGAGDIVDALINGGPAENIDDCEQSLPVIVHYLRHSKVYAADLEDFLVLANIRNFLNAEPEIWAKRFQAGWTEEIHCNCLNECQSILENQLWQELVWREIASDNNVKHYQAVQAGHILELDIWPALFQQLMKDPLNSSLYYEVMRTKDRERINRVIEFAEAKLPLSEIASGPKDEMGVGPGFNAHQCLDFIIQELDEFEGFGNKLLSTALMSPVTRNRNMVLKVLEVWKPEFWPEDAKEILNRLTMIEPVKETKMKVIEIIRKL